jgi:hypothetical protein
VFVFSVADLFGRFHLVCLGLALSLLALAIIILKLSSIPSTNPAKAGYQP